MNTQKIEVRPAPKRLQSFPSTSEVKNPHANTNRAQNKNIIFLVCLIEGYNMNSTATPNTATLMPPM